MAQNYGSGSNGSDDFGTLEGLIAAGYIILIGYGLYRILKAFEGFKRGQVVEEDALLTIAEESDDDSDEGDSEEQQCSSCGRREGLQECSEESCDRIACECHRCAICGKCESCTPDIKWCSERDCYNLICTNCRCVRCEKCKICCGDLQERISSIPQTEYYECGNCIDKEWSDGYYASDD